MILILAFLFASIFCISLSSCKKILLKQKTVNSTQLKMPIKDLDIELLSYYPAKNANESSFYITRNIKNEDTILIIDKENSSISNFIKNYDGIENTSLVLRRGKFQKKNDYYISIPEDYNLINKKIYLGNIIRLVE